MSRVRMGDFDKRVLGQDEHFIDSEVPKGAAREQTFLPAKSPPPFPPPSPHTRPLEISWSIFSIISHVIGVYMLLTQTHVCLRSGTSSDRLDTFQLVPNQTLYPISEVIKA